MTVTRLDPKTALVVIDLQSGIVGYPTVHPIGDIIGHARRLTDAFRARALPVVLVNVAGVPPGRTEQPPRLPAELPPGWLDLIPELGCQPGDILVTKRSRGAFATTDLAARLQAIGVTQIVLCGVATSAGVESTARQAYEQGFHVTLAIDAMTDMARQAHDHSIAQVFPWLGEQGTTQEIIALLPGPA